MYIMSFLNSFLSGRQRLPYYFWKPTKLAQPLLFVPVESFNKNDYRTRQLGSMIQMVSQFF